MDSLAKIREDAAQWMARRISQDWTAQQQAELEQWLNASTSHRVEFLRLESLWRKSDRLKILGVGAQRGTVPTLDDWSTSPFFKHMPKGELHSVGQASTVDRLARRRRRTRYAIAAGVLVAAAALPGFWMVKLLHAGAEYSTAVGVTAAIPLSDGSKVMLNTASEIRAVVTAEERRIHLEAGEAFFDVARDAARPFTVVAGKKQIIALGTQFSVRRQGDDVRVIVTQGKVRVESAESTWAQLTQAMRVAKSERPQPAAVDGVILTAGDIASTHEDQTALLAKPLDQAQEFLSWRSGYLVFHETTLTDAVEEFNRYNTRKFIVRDPELSGLHVSGNFRSTNVDSFARLLERGFPIRATRSGNSIVLTRR